MDEVLKTQIDQIKATGASVYSIKIANTQYIYRSINRKEFRDLQGSIAKIAEDLRAKFTADEAKLNSELSLLKEKGEEKLVLKALVSPVIKSELDLDLVSAGAVTKLADLIMKASGFDDVEVEQPQQI